MQLQPEVTTLTLETCIIEKTLTEPHQTVKTSKVQSFAKHIEKLGGVPHYTNNKKKRK